MQMWGKWAPSRGNIKCKGPEAGTSLTLKGSYSVFQEKSKEESKVGSKIEGRGQALQGLLDMINSLDFF